MTGARRGRSLDYGFWLLFPAILLPSNAPAQETRPPDLEPGSTFQIRLDNDEPAGTDRGFTAGFSFHWLSAPRPVGKAGPITRWLAGERSQATTRTQVTVTQAIYTPDDIRTPELLPDDRPYAGILFARIGIPVVVPEHADLYSLTVGWVGPASGAEGLQRFIHRVTDNVDPAGWANQLPNEPVIQARWDRRWAGRRVGGQDAMQAHLFPHTSAGVGTVSVDGALGMTARVGWGLGGDPGWPGIRPGGFRAPAAPALSRSTLETYVTVEGKAVAHDIFLDGTVFTDSHSVERRPFTANLLLGVRASRGRIGVAYETVFWTRKFETESRPQIYSSLMISLF